MNPATLEHYYENIILPFYKTEDLSVGIKWKDHGKVGPDAWAHYFDDNTGREYVLLYEDFPGGEYLDDGLTHDIVLCDGEVSLHISAKPHKLVDNVIGYFTLYRERRW